MKKFDEYLNESLAAEVKSEPSSAAAAEARKMGLQYVGFGRYADSKGQVAYVVDKERLVPFKRREEIHGMYQKIHSAPPASAPKNGEKPGVDKMAVMNKQADQFNNTLKKRTREDQKIFKQKYKEIEQTNKTLNSAYKPENFDDAELSAIQSYTGQDFAQINRYLYKGHDEDIDAETDQRIADTIAALDGAFEGTKAPIDFTVYSGLSARYNPAKIQAGQTYVFRGYLSTSLDYSTAVSGFTDMSDSAVVLQIDVKKGQKAIHTGAFSENPDEMETLLPRGSRVKIISGPHSIPSDAVNADVLGDGFSINLFHCALIEDL